jgi:hypothetical protein
MAKKTTYKNLDAIPTWKIKEILDHHSTQSMTGQDYEPVRHELEEILFHRQQIEFERQMHRRRIEEKKAFKAMARAHKTKHSAQEKA